MKISKFIYRIKKELSSKKKIMRIGIISMVVVFTLVFVVKMMDINMLASVLTVKFQQIKSIQPIKNIQPTKVIPTISTSSKVTKQILQNSCIDSDG